MNAATDPFERLEETLYKAAQSDAHLALTTYGDSDPQIVRRAAIAMGTSIEYLLAAIVVSVDPVLLASPTSVASMVALSQGGQAAGHDLTRYITAKQEHLRKVVSLACLSVNMKDLEPHLHVLANSRNAAAHAALVPSGSLDQSAVALARAVSALHPGFRYRDLSDFWGDPLESVVKELLDAKSDAVRQRVEGKLARARAHISFITEGLSEDVRGQVLETREQRWTPAHVPNTNSETAICPACGKSGYLTVRRDRLEPPRIEDDVNEDGWTVGSYAVFEVVGVPVRFQCPVCELALIGPDELMVFPGYADDRDLNDETEPLDNYLIDWEPDEDWSRER